MSPDGHAGRPRASLVFGAGLGRRMGALTADRPKPLIPVAGRALIDHALDLARGAGAAPIIVNVHHHAALMRAHLSPDVLLSDETAALLETGGGLRAALPLLGPGPVWTLNGDAAWRGANPLAALAAAWDPRRMEALLLLVPRERALGHAGAGDFALGADGRLSRGPGTERPFVYTGAQVLVTDALAAIPDAAFSLNRLWDDAEARGGLFGLPYDGEWCDVGRPESVALAEAMLAGPDASHG